jgi:hypothetical protein
MVCCITLSEPTIWSLTEGSPQDLVIQVRFPPHWHYRFDLRMPNQECLAAPEYCMFRPPSNRRVRLFGYNPENHCCAELQVTPTYDGRMFLVELLGRPHNSSTPLTETDTSWRSQHLVDFWPKRPEKLTDLRNS